MGELDNKFPHSLVVKYSDNINGRLERTLDNRTRGEQRLKLTQNVWWVEFSVLEKSYISMWHSMLVEGSELSIEVHKKHSLRPKYLERAPRDDPTYTANIKFDDLWKQLSSGTGENGEGIFTLIFWFTHRTSAKFKVEFDNPIQGLQLWLVIEVRYQYYCYVVSSSKYNCRVTSLIWTRWIHRSRKWSWNWTSYSLFYIVLLLQAMLLEWGPI